MKKAEIKEFFKKIKSLKLSYNDKSRMLKLIQVRGLNNKNKVFTYKNFREEILTKNGKINHLVLGPNWNRLVFVDVNFEV